MREIAQKFERKFDENFFSLTLGSVVKIFRLDDAFWGILELEASPVEEGQLQQKDKKRRERKGGKK